MTKKLTKEEMEGLRIISNLGAASYWVGRLITHIDALEEEIEGLNADKVWLENQILSAQEPDPSGMDKFGR